MKTKSNRNTKLMNLSQYYYRCFNLIFHGIHLKFQLLILLILISLIPQTSSLPISCTQKDEVCFDPNLDIEKGNIYHWVVTENLVNGQPRDYGENTIKPLQISIKILKDFKGVPEEELRQNVAQYFDLKKNHVGRGWEPPITAFSSFLDAVSFVVYPSEISNWFRLLAPTIIIKSNGSNNIFHNSVQEWSKYKQYPYSGKNNIYHSQSITSNVHYYSFLHVSDRTDFTGSEISNYTTSWEIETNIDNGLIQKIHYIHQDFRFNKSSSYIVNYDTSGPIRLDFLGISDNFPLVIVIIFTMILLISIIIYRKID